MPSMTQHHAAEGLLSGCHWSLLEHSWWPLLVAFPLLNAVGILVRGWASERLGYAHRPAAAVSPSTQISDSLILSTTAHKDLCFSLLHDKQSLQETDLIMGTA